MRIQNRTFANLTFGGVTLTPGWNTLMGDKAKAVRGDAAYAKAVADRSVVVQRGPAVSGVGVYDKSPEAKPAKAPRSRPSTAASAASPE